MQGKSRTNRTEQKSQQNGKESFIRCKHCRKSILANNYLIHQARCTLMSSRIPKQQIEEKTQIQPEEPRENPYILKKQEFKKEEIRPKKYQDQYRYTKGPQVVEKNRIRKQEQLQRIACPFCGYPQTLAELDTHPLQCEHRQETCQKCGDKFPRSLMRQHLQVCRNNQVAQQNRNNQRWMEQHQEEDNYNPFGNLRNILFNTFMVPQNNPRRAGYTIIQRTDGRGNVNREVIMDEPQGVNRNTTNQNQNPSPFANFFAILQLMAGRNTLRSQGLTKQQIKNLKRFNYQGNNSMTKEGEKDLCTICYCQFQKGQRLVELRCKHSYHEQCITKWIEKTAKCPVCKAPQTSRPIFEEQQEYF